MDLAPLGVSTTLGYVSAIMGLEVRLAIRSSGFDVPFRLKAGYYGMYEQRSNGESMSPERFFFSVWVPGPIFCQLLGVRATFFSTFQVRSQGWPL